MKRSRSLPSVPSTVTVVKDAAGRYFATHQAGDVVTCNGVSHRCLQGRTAQTGREPPAVPALRQPVRPRCPDTR
ncbi:carbohydrate-binding protein [Kitasatospora sp. NPDC093102]|uniref:carbohydrate-binding protein n=1 Tax=Kitasatospora sp. NPDC093102 TaxID=3155069 RepID=UPI0034129659